MASQSVLLPSNASLFITDKSWLRRRNAAKPGQSTFRLGEPPEMDGLSVTVVKTAIKSGRTASKDPRSAENVPRNRGLQFVNTTSGQRGKRNDAELRRLVRSHVMTGTKRRVATKPPKPLEPDEEEEERRQFEVLSSENDEYNEEIFSPYSSQSWPSSTSSSMSLIPSDTSTPLYGITSFKIQPQFHRFISYYTTSTALAMYPLQQFLNFNPVKTSWFPTALTDEVLLHTIMYSAASGISQADPNGSSNSKDMTDLVGPILRLLASRLVSPDKVNDASIGAVSCLVMVENLSNNRGSADVHMKGLQQMIRTRGGLEDIDPNLVMKIIRADVEGSADNMTEPLLPPLKRQTPSLYSTLPAYVREQPSQIFGDSVDSQQLLGQLQFVLLDLSNFTTAMQHYTSQHDLLLGKIDSRSFDEDLLSITRDLLSFSTLTLPEQVITIAALIFTKSIGRGLPFVATASQILPKTLKQALSLGLSLESTHFDKTMLLWVLFMGGVASNASSNEEIWFVNKLVEMRNADSIPEDWDATRSELKDVLFVDVVHDEPCQKLFKQVEKIADLKKRWDKQSLMPL